MNNLKGEQESKKIEIDPICTARFQVKWSKVK